jgi:hypothetical protein
MPEFQNPVDIGNRALDHCGADAMDQTAGFTEQSQRARLVARTYGKLRRAELRENVWTFATRRTALRSIDSNTVVLAPTLWSSAVTYFVGSIVVDASGTIWESVLRDNLNNQQQNTPAWVPYFGPMTAALYDSGNVYFAGELVYTAAGDGTVNIYKALIDNPIHPALPNLWSTNTTYMTDQVVVVFPAYASGTTYAAGQSVTGTDGNIYSSLVGGNLGHTPQSAPTFWVLMPTLVLASLQVPTTAFPSPPVLPGTTPIDEWHRTATYSSGSFVMFNGSIYLAIASANTGNVPSTSASFWALCSGGTAYLSLVDLNIGNAPATSPSQWTTSFVQGSGNPLWMQVGGAAFPNGVGITAVSVPYPLGQGPMERSWQRNVFRLPANYLRRAPQEPKAGNFSWLGAPGNLPLTDWTYSGQYITSMDAGPLIFRFVADVQDVTQFDDMFCEGLAARIGMEIAPSLTQSEGKLGSIAKVYDNFMTRARTANAIEQGPEEPPLDDLIACRY